jgi:lipopolysaccharide export system protein LptA
VTVTAPDLSVTAKNGIDYYTAENKAVATGDAVVRQKAQTLRAQKITAWFDKDNKLQRAEADGNVVIVQPKKEGGQDIAQADHGTYDLKSNNALLRGNVKLTQGDNHMQGDTATIDLATGYSSLKNTGNSGRVRAIFTPGGGTPGLTSTVPMIKAKQNFEPAYAVGKN